MKKIVLIAIILFFNQDFTFAQIKKGALFLGPSFNYNRNDTKNKSSSYIDTYSQSNLLGNVKLGYFLTNRLVAGAVLIADNDVRKEKRETSINETEKITKTNLFGAGVFIRAYKMMEEGKIGFFGELEGYYGFGKTKANVKSQGPLVSSVTYPDVDNSAFTLALRPGIVYFITSKIGMEISIGNILFQNNTAKGDFGTTNTNRLNASFGFNTFFLGAKFYLGAG